MAYTEDHLLTTPFANEQECVAYLFRKRWPWGFKCPFCGTIQQEMAPAYVVVCRYCRKQTSITAHTLMHGSKKSLTGWIRVAWQFCFTKEGISARELQRLMELSCYQTAWGWLQKMRRGAALAEAEPCGDIVLFDRLLLPAEALSGDCTPEIGIALELGGLGKGRVRITRLQHHCPDAITDGVNSLVEENATLLIKKREWLLEHCRIDSDHVGQPTRAQLEQRKFLEQKLLIWLNNLYRRAITSSHLQSYLDEFCFRHNTASWTDRRAILDHLITGLLSTKGKAATKEKATEEDPHE